VWVAVFVDAWIAHETLVDGVFDHRLVGLCDLQGFERVQ
jgi:hypothetical protein